MVKLNEKPGKCACPRYDSLGSESIGVCRDFYFITVDFISGPDRMRDDRKRFRAGNGAAAFWIFLKRLADFENRGRNGSEPAIFEI
jgi:hypothetical protein